MKWNDMLLLSLTNLWRRKMRTILTVVGVMIGTCSIIIMVSIGLGANKTLLDDAMGQNDLTLIRVSDQSYWDSSMKNKSLVKLDDQLIRKFEKVEHVVLVTPVMNISGGEFKTGKYVGWGNMIGIKKEAFEAFSVPFIEGSGFASGTTKEIEITIGKDNKSSFQKPNSRVWDENPKIDWLGDKFTFTASYYNNTTQLMVDKKYKVKVVGITGIDNPRKYSQFNYGMYVDIALLKKLVKENPKVFTNTKTDSYQEAWVKVDDYKNVEKVMDALKKDNKLQVNSDMEWINSIKKQAQSMQLLLGGIGAITMLVAAISIANTMLMSIYERTREIGVMKVLGCKLSNISMLFLGEAGFIGLFGGIVGLGLSYILSAVLNYVFTYYQSGGYGGMQSYLPPWLGLAALVFSVLVGLISGLYPSQRAMNLSALAAIRNEA